MDKRISEPVSILEGAGVDFWIDSGTLLGLHRDGKIIEGDTDIDISVLENQTGKLLSLIPTFRDKGYYVKYAHAEGHVMKVFNPTMVGAIDVAINFWTEGGDWLTTIDRADLWKIPVDLVLPADSRVKGPSAPHKVEEYLEYRYGPDWRTPDPNWQRAKDGMFYVKTGEGWMKSRTAFFS